MELGLERVGCTTYLGVFSFTTILLLHSYVTWQEYLLDQAIYALASRLNKPAVHVVVNELEMKKPVGERKVVFAADNENIRIMHARIQAQQVADVGLTLDPVSGPFRAAGLPEVTDERDIGQVATEQVLVHR